MEILYNTKSLPNIQSDIETLSEIATGINANSVHGEIRWTNKRKAVEINHIIYYHIYYHKEKDRCNLLIYNDLMKLMVGVRSYVLIYITDYQCHMFIQFISVFNFLHTPIFDMKPPIWIQMDMFYGHVQKY